MLTPSCENSAASPSNTQPEPNVFDTHHSTSRTFTTNQPSLAGARPEPESSSCASGIDAHGPDPMWKRPACVLDA